MGGVPNYCPGCFGRQFIEIDFLTKQPLQPGAVIDKSRSAFSRAEQGLRTGQEARAAGRWSDEGTMYEEGEVASDKVEVLDPQEEFINILSDVGLKSKKRVITQTIFENGDPSNPKWVDEVLRIAGLDISRRRLILMRVFGKSPEKLGIKLMLTGEDESVEVVEESEDSGDETFVDKEYKKMQKAEIEDMRIRLNERKLKLLKKRLGDEDRDDGRGKNGEEKIEIPVMDDTGKPVADKSGQVVFMKVTPMQLYYMSMMKQQSPKKEESDFSKYLLQQLDFFQKKLLDDSGKKEVEVLRIEWAKDREKMLEGVFKLREAILKRELQETRQQVRGPMDLYNYVKEQIELGQKMGLIATDDKNKKFQNLKEVGDRLVGKMDNLQAEGRFFLQKFMDWAKEERDIQRGGGKQVKKLTDDEKREFYLKGAEDYRQALIKKMEGEQQQKLPEQQKAEPPKADVQPSPQIQNQPDIHPEPAQNAPEQKSPEQQTPEQKIPEQKTPEEKTPEQKPTEEQKPEEKKGNSITDRAVEHDLTKAGESRIDVHILERPVTDTMSKVEDKAAPVDASSKPRWGVGSVVEGLTDNPLDEMEVVEHEKEPEPELSSKANEYRDAHETHEMTDDAPPPPVTDGFMSWLDGLELKMNVVDNGLRVSWAEDKHEVLTLESKHGTKAHIAVVDGRPIVKALTFTKDVSQTEADFWARKTIEDMKKGTCPICAKARQILLKDGRKYLVK